LASDSAGRAAISRAASEIDGELSEFADTVGEGRLGNLRIHYVPPLGFKYELETAKRVAKVVNVWWVK
jgi:hypothetical protein